MINLRFCTGNGPISRAIRMAEYGFWASHVEAVMPAGNIIGAHADGGVMAREPGYDKGSSTKEAFVSLETDDATEQRFCEFMRAQVGKPYDFSAIAGFMLGRNWRENDSWFCSELVTAALEHSGWMPTLCAGAGHISPRDLMLVLSARVSIPNQMESENG